MRQIFRASTSWTLGDGNKCRFWIDPWLDGSSIVEIAPVLVALVPKRRHSRQLVSEAIPRRSWIGDIQGALGVESTIQYVDIWRRLSGISLQNSSDSIRWKWTESGTYSAKSCYLALFHGSIVSRLGASLGSPGCRGSKTDSRMWGRYEEARS